MPSSAIFDASVVVRWMVDDSLTPAALEAAKTYRPVAPLLLGSEVANALRTQVKAGRHEADWCLTQVRRLPNLMQFEDERPLWPMALRLAVEHDHSAYDCIYVAMALTLAVPLITGDVKLARKFDQLPGLDLRTLQDWTS